MSAPAIDPLDDAAAVGRGGVPRDGYGRALLVPPGGGERVPYTSMSTLAAQLNAFQKPLHDWELRMVAKGVGMSRELAALAGSSRYDTRIGEEDESRNREEAQILDEVVLHAKELAGAHQKARWGSAFHRYAEVDDPLGEPPEEMARDLEAFREALRRCGIKILATEIFVVNETLQAAGSFDYALYVPWRPGMVVIGDSKTGKLKPDQCEIQLAGYATSEIYDRDTDERISFHDAFGMHSDKQLGIIPHTPPTEAVSELWPVDLEAGFASAALARDVHRRNSEARKRYGKRVWKPIDVEAQEVLLVETELGKLEMAQGSFVELQAALKALHREHKAIWREEWSQLGGRLLRDLKAREGVAV